jgi:thiosulfate/3-mercaptopyruvate sulfurtransferase
MHTIKKIFTFTAIGILVFGLTVPAGAFLENKFEKEVEKEAGAVKLVHEVQRGGYDVVTTQELKKWIDSGKDMVIVDTMPFEASYKNEHVPGAVQFLFPIPEMKQWDYKETDGKSQEDFMNLLGGDKDKLIVIYCGFVKCTRSHNGATWAVKLGYKKVYRYPGGIFAWKGANYPVEKAK